MDIAESAVNIATLLYGVTPHAASLCQSTSSHVFHLEFGDVLESKILKIARPGSEQHLLREQQILPALRLRGFEVPPIEFTQESVDNGTGVNMPFTSMPFIPGGWIGDVGLRAPAHARAAYEHLGHFMARLSVLDSKAIPGARMGAEFFGQLEHAGAEGQRLLRLHPRCTVRLEALLEQGRDLRRETSGFVHWDGVQVITDGVSTFTVIDWGTAGAGHRLLDLAAFLMNHAFQKHDGQPIYPEWRASVLHGFLGGRPLAEETRLQLHLLGTSGCILDAMMMAKQNHRSADDLLTFIEAEDTAFQEARLERTSSDK
ncbi:MAG: aminoglycoside phosphotransferase family protein [Armatimonadota bacterium]